MQRRTVLRGLTLVPTLAACAPPGAPSMSAPSPVLFLAHGSPMSLDDAAWMARLGAWAVDLPRPRAVLMLSAHWVDAPLRLGATATVPLTYDYYGFPERFYRVRYPAPGAPELAARVRGLLAGRRVEASDRGLDHGVFIPLLGMYPQADIPVLQLSLPTLEPAPLLELGRELAPLRDEGVLIVGSGFLTHNLRALDLRPGAPTPAWAHDFDAWAADVLVRQDVDALLAYRERAPGVRTALPTHEHFAPVVAAMGAALERPGGVRFPIDGFAFGSLTWRSVQFG
jgi:4,5-DOPA dioxygenase extradiol